MKENLDKQNDPIFKGIPDAMDYLSASRIYYNIIKNTTKEKFGKEATLHHATTAMRMHGNLRYFSWFPDLYTTDKEELGQFYNPFFRLAGANRYADYLHGLTHIRSLSANTNMGESLLIPDNYYAVGVRYQKYLKANKERALDECIKSPFEEFELGKSPIPYQKIWLMNIRFDSFKYQDRAMKFYAKIYKKGFFKADFPEERASENFLILPINAFETRLSYNVVRAIFMDEKFKMFSSQNKAFIKTPVSVSSKESYKLAFTDEEEEHWINELAIAVRSANPSIKIQTLINTTEKKDGYAKKIAANTAKEIVFFL